MHILPSDEASFFENAGDIEEALHHSKDIKVADTTDEKAHSA